ncbi:MAG TPA: zinc-ribbon domain containing protein [Candidatus Limnocylindrales bacterium]|nr:zinc-ribbon domain containing protein [Candidatus Limnocylindrales bacterium]
MKSGKQRRAEIDAKRKQKAAKRQAVDQETDRPLRPVLGPPVNEALLAPNNSYGAPDFVYRGYYVDRPFRCVDCGKDEVWTGTQQKWWYEVAKGFAYSSAIRCRLCRRKERHRRDDARGVHLAGIERKKQLRGKD